MTLDRRRFLRVAAASLGVGGLGTIAGCSSSCPDSGRPEPDTILSISDDPAGPFPSAPAGSWPTSHGNAGRTGYTTASFPDEDIAVRWRTDLSLPNTDRGGLSASAPAVGNGMVVVADSQRVHALSLRTGEVRWRSDPIGATFLDSLYEHEANTPVPAIAPDGTVFVGTTDGVVALDGADGSVRWRIEDMTDVTSPAIVGNTVFAQGADTLVGLRHDGTEWWRRSIGRGDPPVPPAVDSTSLVVVTDEGLAGFDPANGDDRWRSDRRVETHPVVASGTCYAGNYDGLHALDAASGDLQWTFTRGDFHAQLSPVIAPDTIYTVEQPGEAGAASFALDRTDGEPEARWCSSIGSGAITAATDDVALGSLTIWEGPAAAQGIVAFSESLGASRWAVEGGSRPRDWITPPAVVDGAMILTTRGGTTVAVGGGT